MAVSKVRKPSQKQGQKSTGERILREIKLNSKLTPTKQDTTNNGPIMNEPPRSFQDRSTPNSSQSTAPSSPLQPSTPTSTPPSSSNIRHATKQSVFTVGINEKITCENCGMTYFKHVDADKKLHSQFHKKVLNGRDWSVKWGTKIQDINSSQDEYICCVNPKNSTEMKATIDLLDLVNHDLNAPEDNEFWLKGDDSGKVFVYVKNGRAIGVVSVERITQGTFLSIEDGQIARNIKLELLAGVSRIYVCKKYRRMGIGLRLLGTLQTHFIYGMIIPKNKIAWSQPSFAGGKLATSFNGIKHKSGRVLVPVYTT